MVTLADVRDYLKSFNLFDGYYVGRIDASKKNVLGVYDLSPSTRHRTIGKGTRKYDVKGVSLLIHGDTNKDRTERLAIRLYEALERVNLLNSYTWDEIKSMPWSEMLDDSWLNTVPLFMGDKKIYIIDLQQDAPIDVDTDSSKIYEYVIEVLFYVERED